MQPNARQVLLPGDRSLIEGCLACELHLKVLWHGWTAWAGWKYPFSCQIYNSTLQDDATSWPSFAWSHCEIEHLPRDALTGCTSDAFLLVSLAVASARHPARHPSCLTSHFLKRIEEESQSQCRKRWTWENSQQMYIYTQQKSSPCSTKIRLRIQDSGQKIEGSISMRTV